MLTTISRGISAAQILFGLVVLILSIILVKQQFYGTAPATLGYGAFAGAFVAVAAVVSIAATFIDRIPDIVVVGLDAVAGLFALAGGIAFAIGTKGFNCDVKNAANLEKLSNSPLMYEGKKGNRYGIVDGTCKSNDSETKCGKKVTDALEARCRQVVADQALLFIAFGLAASAAAMAFFIWKKGKRGGGSRYYA